MQTSSKSYPLLCNALAALSAFSYVNTCFSERESSFYAMQPTGRCTGLLVIEAQERYRNTYGPDMINSLSRVARAFSDRGLPIFGRVWNCGCGDSAAGRWEGCEPSSCDFTDLSRFENRLLPELDVIMDSNPINNVWFSTSYSMFANVPLNRRLQALGVDTVVITGGYTNMCVFASAIHAHSLGLSVIVPYDAVGPAGRLEQVNDRSLELMRHYGIAVVNQSTDEVLKQLPDKDGCNNAASVEPMVPFLNQEPFLAPYPADLIDSEGIDQGFIGPNGDGDEWDSKLIKDTILEHPMAWVQFDHGRDFSLCPHITQFQLPAKSYASAFLSRVTALQIHGIKTVAFNVTPPHEKRILVMAYLAHSFDFDVVLVGNPSNSMSSKLTFHLLHTIAIGASADDVERVNACAAGDFNRTDKGSKRTHGKTILSRPEHRSSSWYFVPSSCFLMVAGLVIRDKLGYAISERTPLVRKVKDMI